MLPKQHRLTEKRDFKRVMTYGRSFFVPEFGLKVLKKSAELSTRVGIIVPKKLTKTVVKRNRIKRQIRNVFLGFIKQMPPGYDIVFLTRPALLGLRFQEMQEKIKQALRKVF
jgi:ribonuclease P protein component